MTGLSNQSYGHRVQGLVFGSKGLAALADKYADLQETNQDLELIDLIGLQNWLMLKLNGSDSDTAE